MPGTWSNLPPPPNRVRPAYEIVCEGGPHAGEILSSLVIPWSAWVPREDPNAGLRGSWAFTADELKGIGHYCVAGTVSDARGRRLVLHRWQEPRAVYALAPVWRRA